MAIFHFAAKIMSRAASHNAVAAAAYRSAGRFHCERTGAVKNYHYKGREVVHGEIATPDNAPAFAQDRAALWNMVERIEKRRDAQLAREVVVALPVELSLAQQIDLLNGYVHQAFVAQGMIADWNIHYKPGNPHCHILLTLRDIGPSGFGPKNRSWNDAQQVERWRALWAKHCNQALAAAGSDERIDHRTLASQGIDHRAPTVHVGRDNGLNSAARAERIEHNALQKARHELHRIKQEETHIHRQIAALDSNIIDLKTSLAQALAQRGLPQMRQPNGNPLMSLEEAHQMRRAQPPPGSLILPWAASSHTDGATPAPSTHKKEEPQC